MRRIVLFTAVAALACGSYLQTPLLAKEKTQVRQLVICIDGVGYSMIEQMRAEGRFQRFRSPSRMIAPFPTLTNLAMTQILAPAGAAPALGYEDNYFDAGQNSIKGGVIDRLRGERFIKGTFREVFDYHPSAIKSGLGYAAPPISTYLEAVSDLVRLRQKVSAADEPMFFAYTGATDSLAHLGGGRLLRSFLRRLDDCLSDIVRESAGRTEITIFSDHGNHFTNYKRIALKSALRRAGMHIEDSVRDEQSVVFPQFGLIGCAMLFTEEKNEHKLAHIVSQVRGVDFASYERDGIVHVVGPRGQSTIERHGESFRYRVSGAGSDPLELAELMRDLTLRSKADADGFIADADWFAATGGNKRPDTVRRIYEGATDHVRSRANILISFEDGYYTGSFALDVFAVLHATHGNIRGEQTYGFAMTTDRGLPRYIRARDLWTTIGSPVNTRSNHHH